MIISFKNENAYHTLCRNVVVGAGTRFVPAMLWEMCLTYLLVLSATALDNSMKQSIGVVLNTISRRSSAPICATTDGMSSYSLETPPSRCKSSRLLAITLETVRHSALYLSTPCKISFLQRSPSQRSYAGSHFIHCVTAAFCAIPCFHLLMGRINVVLSRH